MNFSNFGGFEFFLKPVNVLNMKNEYTLISKGQSLPVHFNVRLKKKHHVRYSIHFFSDLTKITKFIYYQTSNSKVIDISNDHASCRCLSLPYQTYHAIGKLGL